MNWKEYIILAVFAPIYWLILVPLFVVSNGLFLIFQANYDTQMEIHKRDPYRPWVLFCLKINRFIKRGKNE